MPCNSDYMGPNDDERRLATIYGLLDELETGQLPDNFGDGYDRRTYGKRLSKAHRDKKTDELCQKLQNVDTTKYSLELQMWWRDHQKADKDRLEEEIRLQKQNTDKWVALSKLTAYERQLLGIR